MTLPSGSRVTLAPTLLEVDDCVNTLLGSFVTLGSLADPRSNTLLL